MEDKGLIDQLLSSPVRAINVGVEDFAESLEAQGTEVVHVSWSPPSGGDQEIIAILNQIL